MTSFPATFINPLNCFFFVVLAATDDAFLGHDAAESQVFANEPHTHGHLRDPFAMEQMRRLGPDIPDKILW